MGQHSSKLPTPLQSEGSQFLPCPLVCVLAQLFPLPKCHPALNFESHGCWRQGKWNPITTRGPKLEGVDTLPLDHESFAPIAEANLLC
jgi:hypothetical protein